MKSQQKTHMGNCSSCESTDVATAKVILQDGSLQEFACPIRVSQVLEKNPNCFICNSDDMDFDSIVSTMNGEEALCAGQLYFALPMSLSEKPLMAEEMAALAVKASLALKASNFGRHQRRCGSSCGLKRVDAAVYTTKEKVLGLGHLSREGGVVTGGSRVVGGRGGGRGGGGRGFVEEKKRVGGGARGSLTTKLNVIMEDQSVV